MYTLAQSVVLRRLTRKNKLRIKVNASGVDAIIPRAKIVTIKDRYLHYNHDDDIYHNKTLFFRSKALWYTWPRIPYHALELVRFVHAGRRFSPVRVCQLTCFVLPLSQGSNSPFQPSLPFSYSSPPPLSLTKLSIFFSSIHIYPLIREQLHRQLFFHSISLSSTYLLPSLYNPIIPDIDNYQLAFPSFLRYSAVYKSPAFMNPFFSSSPRHPSSPIPFSQNNYKKST